MHILVQCLAIIYNSELNIFEGPKIKANFFEVERTIRNQPKVNKKKIKEGNEELIENSRPYMSH